MRPLGQLIRSLYIQERRGGDLVLESHLEAAASNRLPQRSRDVQLAGEQHHARVRREPGHRIVAAPGKDAQPVEEAPALPTRVERLLAAVRGEISREELNEDLQCSADAVAIIDACYASSSSGSWVNVEKLG